MASVDIKTEEITVSDGAKIELITYRPKTLESQSAAAYIYAHGGGAFAREAESSAAKPPPDGARSPLAAHTRKIILAAQSANVTLHDRANHAPPAQCGIQLAPRSSSPTALAPRRARALRNHRQIRALHANLLEGIYAGGRRACYAWKLQLFAVAW